MLDVAMLQLPQSRPWERKEGWRRGRGPAAGKMTSLLAATLDPSGRVAAGLMDSEGIGVALPFASPKRCPLFPEVFDDCSNVESWALSSWKGNHQVDERDRFCSQRLGNWQYCWF